MASGQRVHGSRVLERDVVERVVGDVLADSLLAAAADADGGGQARELLAGLELLALERVLVDLQREVGELVERAHRRGTLALPRR